MSNAWSALTDPGTVARRAGGRRRYNAWRQFRAAYRRRDVARLLLDGMRQCDIARALGVHPSTISRDVKYLVKMARENRKCPLCGSQIASPRRVSRWNDRVNGNQGNAIFSY